MTWHTDLVTESGNVVAYKHFSDIDGRVDMAELAQQDADYLSHLHVQHSGDVVHVIDVSGVKPSKRVFQYIKTALHIESLPPKHCYIVGVSKTTQMCFKAIRKLLSTTAAQRTTLHQEPWDSDMKQCVLTCTQ